MYPSPLQEKRHFGLTLAPQFVKDLLNPEISNSGVKVVIMWGYENGAKIYRAKVMFVKKLILALNEYVAFHGVWCKSPKLILNGLRFLWCKSPKLKISGLRFCGAKHQNS